MSYSGSNNWGSYTINNGTDPVFPFYQAPIDSGTIPATGTLVVAQSPSGSVTNESATWNYANELTSTQNVLENVFVVNSGPEGLAAQSNTSSQPVLAGTPSIQLNQFVNTTTTGVGKTGNKFS
jgi:hypothetical protein